MRVVAVLTLLVVPALAFVPFTTKVRVCMWVWVRGWASNAALAARSLESRIGLLLACLL